MSQQRQQVDNGRQDSPRVPRTTTSTRKLASFLGIVAGFGEATSFSVADDLTMGASFDWDPWIRMMMPEFGVVMSDDRRSGSRWPTRLIVAETGRNIPLDRRSCHPSDAYLLLSGDNMSVVEGLINALDPALRGMDDGDRVASACAVLAKLRRICRNDQ